MYKRQEYTGLPVLDEKGRPKLRDSYLLDTLECGESSFAMACLIANRKYGKNGRREDVKTHHYIISFDPKDAVENGLTMERAQALGLQFCKDNFPGHPAIVCTHPDGHNKMCIRDRAQAASYTANSARCCSLNLAGFRTVWSLSLIHI